MHSKVKLHAIDPHKVALLWPLVSDLLQAAVERCGDWTLDGVKSELENDRALLWITTDGGKVYAAAVTRLLETPGGLTCQALACGGEDDDWPARFAVIEDYARAVGCTRTRIAGRKGWARVFRNYELAYVTLEKRLK